MFRLTRSVTGRVNGTISQRGGYRPSRWLTHWESERARGREGEREKGGQRSVVVVVVVVNGYPSRVPPHKRKTRKTKTTPWFPVPAWTAMRLSVTRSVPWRH